MVSMKLKNLTWCYLDELRSAGTSGWSNRTVQAYISPDGSLAFDERMARAFHGRKTVFNISCRYGRVVYVIHNRL